MGKTNRLLYRIYITPPQTPDLLVITISTNNNPLLLQRRLSLHLLLSQLDGRNTKTIMITEEQDALALTLGLSRGLNPLAPARALPDGSDEAKRATLSIRAVVLAHDRLDGLGSLIGVVEGDGRDVVV